MYQKTEDSSEKYRSDLVDISIVIVSWNVCEFIRQCIHSICEFVGDISIEVIVVDNNSSDNTTQILKEEFPWVRLVINLENVGFARANNIAFQLVKGKNCVYSEP